MVRTNSFCLPDKCKSHTPACRGHREKAHPVVGSDDSNQIKSDFINMVSHEFRTPINVLLSSIQLFERMGDDLFLQANREKFIGYHQLVRQNCYRLLRLVNNLIDSAEYDLNHVRLHMANHDLVKLAHEITDQASNFAESKGITLKFSTGLKEIITAFDEEKIQRVLLNLLSNAIKFSSRGDHIRVTVRKNKNHAVLEVKDTGCGISDEKLRHIFNRFSSAEGLTRDHEGCGVGLSLCCAIIRLHKGDIRVTSKPGKGSNFHVELPLQAIESDRIREAAPKLPVSEIVKIELSDSLENHI